VLVTSFIFAECGEIVNAGTKTAEDTEDAEEIVIRSPKKASASSASSAVFISLAIIHVFHRAFLP